MTAVSRQDVGALWVSLFKWRMRSAPCNGRAAHMATIERHARIAEGLPCASEDHIVDDGKCLVCGEAVAP